MSERSRLDVVPGRSEAKGIHDQALRHGSPSLAALAGDDTLAVMAGLVPAIHAVHRIKTWIPGTSPGMTVKGGAR